MGNKLVIIKTLKILGCVVAACLVLMVGTVLVLNTDTFQNKLLRHATSLLSDKLQTRVEIDSISIGLFSQKVNLYGLEVEDLQHRKMFQLDHLAVNVKLLPLLHNEVRITNASIDGVRAQLYKPRPDSAANYQFVIDAFKKDSTESREKEVTKEEKKKEKLNVNLTKLSLSRVDIIYNDQAYKLESLKYRKKGRDKHNATITDLHRSWVSHTKKGDVDNRLTIGSVLLTDNGSKRQATIDGIHFVTDNHQPRKNKGKPKRGAFDAGHLDIEAALKADINSIQGDSIAATITQCNALDKGSGLTLKSLTTKVLVAKGVATFNDVVIQMPNTQLKIANATFQLPNKKLERPLEFSTSPITGRVLLKDIARPFSPVLSGFTIPLLLRVNFSGNAEQLSFQNVYVSTTDKLLTISANGGITGLKDKLQLAVRFHVNKMTAKGNIKERIINQFPVKKFMMKQLYALGNITYHGHFDVLWKKEQFAGLLHTAPGQLNFQFALDELNKYVFGTVRTDSFELGKAMDMPDLGKIACKADFKFDISKPRTAKMRALKGGKLPIGSVKAEVAEGKYKKVKVRNLFAELESDGAVATGNITVKGKRMDVLCGFSFTNTNEMKKTKIKPGIKFHKMSDEDKAARDERRAAKKEAKQQAREERRAARAEQKAERKALRAEQKAEREAARAEKKALKAEEKALKAEEKAARKAAKAEAKAARKAAKAAAKAAEAAEE